MQRGDNKPIGMGLFVSIGLSVGSFEVGQGKMLVEYKSIGWEQEAGHRREVICSVKLYRCYGR